MKRWGWLSLTETRARMASKNYGIPYKGSKNKIAEKLLAVMPSAETFVDLFAGGCAMTHAAILSGQYERFIINDIDPMPTQCFMDAIAGKFRNEKRWISREDFFRLKDTDAYVRYCFSFGNDGATYAYSREIEPFMHMLHILFFAETPYDRLQAWKPVCREILKWIDTGKRLTELRSAEAFYRLIALERLERLQSLERLERLQSDYSSVVIPDNTVIYCDPPYKDSGLKNCYGDTSGFDFPRFYNWCERQTQPLFISEYDMPKDRFTCVFEIEKRCSMGTGNNKKTIERLYRPRSQL